MEICLVVMPFCGVARPSIGVSSIKAALSNIGVTSKIYYFNLEFAKRIGLDLYEHVSETGFSALNLIGELVFSNYAFKRKPFTKQYLEQILLQVFNGNKKCNDVVDCLIDIEKKIPDFIEECASELLSQRPFLIGFTSTFDQHCASLSLARRIKIAESIPIIFGGANCEGEMGATSLRCFPWIDFICSGEGEIAFIELVKTLKTRREVHDINGIVTRKSSLLDIHLTNPVMALDFLPIPDYDDYFSTLKDMPFSHQLLSHLTLETSRGCWWGEKYQCTFCGLNGSTMKYRSKSIPRVVREIEFITNKYDNSRIEVVDNILDMKYIDSLFPEIYAKQLSIVLFYETKSNLSKKQLMNMRKGGVNTIQPGIESLSDSILKLMKKGVSALQNVQLLKYCRELGVVPQWNILYGFPSESSDEYTSMANMIPLLVHLNPPSGCYKISLDRFSPYFINPSEYGLINVRPVTTYRYLYDVPKEELKKIAYHFDFDYSDSRDPDLYVKKLKEEIKKWNSLWKEFRKPSLTISKSAGVAIINDQRYSETKIHLLTEERAKIYNLCETANSFQNMYANMKESSSKVNENDLQYILDDLVKENLLLKYGTKYLSLAVPIKSLIHI